MNKFKNERWSMLLSHHPPSQYCRTYRIAGIRLCARCLGLPIGIALYFALSLNLHYSILLILPIPTFLNFLFQELGIIKSINILKTILTILLGYFLVEIIVQIVSKNFIFAILLILYLIAIEFIIAKILDSNGKLEPLINEYERGIYKKNHTQQKI